MNDNTPLPTPEYFAKLKELRVGNWTDILDPTGRELLDQLTQSMPVSNTDMFIVMALVFGSLAFDSEMQNPTWQFLDRLKMFHIIAAQSFGETAQHAKDFKIYSEGTH